MKKFILPLMLLSVTSVFSQTAQEVKYDCGLVGEFKASVPLEKLLLTFYIKEKEYIVVYDGYGKGFSRGRYLTTLTKKELTKEYFDFNNDFFNNNAYENFKNNSNDETKEALYDRYEEFNQDRIWFFERFKRNGFNKVALMTNFKNSRYGKSLIFIMCGPRK